jgi:PAS domain S-box-containing protein
VFRDGLVDYRGEAVWAATRYIPQTGWGLVIKFDQAEKRSASHEFLQELFSLGLALIGIGMLVAVSLGLRFAAPIHNLAEAANSIREGDLNARATVVREDEIGQLALDFNDMAEDLQAKVAVLHEFQKFFEVSLDMLCIAGTDGFFKRTNPAFEKVLGWSGEELLSRPFLDLVHPDDLEATEDEIAKLAQGIATISFTNRFRCADGSWKCLRWNSYPDPEMDATLLIKLTGGLVYLLAGGDLLVRGAVALGRKFHVPPMIIALTVVSFGTSLPELVVVIQATLSGYPGLVLGNVIGSNIANVLLVAGSAAIIYPLTYGEHSVRRDSVFMMVAMALLVGLCWDGSLDRAGGAVLLIGLVAITALTAREAARSFRRSQLKAPLEWVLGLPTKIGIILLFIALGVISWSWTRPSESRLISASATP